MTADRPLLGVLMMLIFCVLAPLGDGLAKWAGETIPVLQIVTVRFGAQLALLVPVLWVTGRVMRLAPDLMWLTLLRTVLHVGALAALFAALTVMPLAEALAIVFVQPFLLLLLAWAFMGEETGIRRLSACAVGFAGTLLVIQPSFAAFGPVVFLPLVTAGAFTGFIIVTRRVAKRADPIALQAVSGAMGTAILAPILIVGALIGTAPLAPVMPDAAGWALLAALGVVGTLGHLVMTMALRYAPSATLAPVQYMELPFTVAVGWVLFRDFPNALAMAGIVVITGAGLYIVLRERALNRSPHPAPRAPAPAPPAAGSRASRAPKTAARHPDR